jgi:hypothetical protein
MGKRYTIAVDFDGVLHRYDTPFIAPHVIPDGPVDGAIEWLFYAVQKFDVVIFTTRGKTWRGRRAVRAWIKQHADSLWYPSPDTRGVEEITVTAVKPAALVYIDDRAWRFEGRFPKPQEVHDAKPWHKVVAHPVATTHERKDGVEL